MNSFKQMIFNSLKLVGVDNIHYNDFYSNSLRNKKNGKYILLACMPKSGSTNLVNSIATYLNYQVDTFRIARGQIEQELYEPKLINKYGENYIIHQHVKASSYTLKLIEKYQIKPIVLTRNIFDIIMSFYDHLEKTKNEKLDLIIDFLTPWLINFYTSWFRVKSNDILWLTYEDLYFRDNAKVKIEDFISVDLSNLEINSKKNNNRYNKGIMGRGEKELNFEQKARIIRHSSYFNDINFAKIGL